MTSFKAQVKDVKSRNLVSGDKEVRFVLMIVGGPTDAAIELAKLAPAALVEVSFEETNYSKFTG